MNIKLLISSFIISCALTLSAQIIEAPRLDIVEEQILKLNHNDLVVFDVDLTLIVPKDQVLAPCGRNFYLKARREGYQNLGEEKMAYLASIVLLKSESQLVNPKILDLLSDLDKKNIKTIALTAVRSGSFGKIANMEDWRLHQLDKFAIDFRKAFPFCKNVVLEKCQGQKNPAVFKEGILFSGYYPKGEVLMAFLEKMDFCPEKIIFVDDKIDFIQTVESACEKKGVPCLSFHYTEAFQDSREFDINLAEFQLKHLCEQEEWLSDEEAKKILYSEYREECCPGCQ